MALFRERRVCVAAKVAAELGAGLGVELPPELLDLAPEELVLGFELAYAHEWWGDGGDLLWGEREDGLQLRHCLLELCEGWASGRVG